MLRDRADAIITYARVRTMATPLLARMAAGVWLLTAVQQAHAIDNGLGALPPMGMHTSDMTCTDVDLLY